MERRRNGVTTGVGGSKERVRAVLWAVAAAPRRDAGAVRRGGRAAATSPVPIFDGRDLAEGSHLNGVGSYTLDMQELDAETVGRSRVFVDSREAALAEAGDLAAAERAGRTRRDDWTELGEVAAGHKPGRRSDGEVTFFKSVGVAVQDVKAAAAALERARELGLGKEVEL